MNDQTIPADKVRELADKYDKDSSGNPERLLVQAIADLRALLPTQQPTSGLLGRWAKHPEHGDVLCVWDKEKDGRVGIRNRVGNDGMGVGLHQVPLDSLTFPHQATKPEEVPAGEAWRIRDKNGREYNAVKAPRGYYTEPVDGIVYEWLVCDDDQKGAAYNSEAIDLVAPLVPERPVSDLQARYDELETKYWEQQSQINKYEQERTPRTVTTEHDYAALPVRSVVAGLRGETWEKTGVGLWSSPSQRRETTNADLAGNTREVLRYGWGDEQPKPAWRIEHDHTNLSEGEYIIDKYGDTGTVHKNEMDGSLWCIGLACIGSKYGPFIVFRNKDAATPDAVAEATEVRAKETGE